jgi:hypothetical protein
LRKFLKLITIICLFDRSFCKRGRQHKKQNIENGSQELVDRSRRDENHDQNIGSKPIEQLVNFPY